MTEFNFTRENIIYNLDNNKHNNITTTYELLLKRYKMEITSARSGLNSITSASSIGNNSILKNNSNGIKINLKKEEINIIIYKNSNESNSNNKLSKSYRGKNSSLNNKKRYRNTFNGNSINKTIDSNNSNLSNKNGFGSSLDIKKVIKKKNFKGK